jgi:hypothetical protein
MPFRSIVAEPEVLARLSHAFDQTWAAIGDQGTRDPLRESAQRERLAHIIIRLWQIDPDGDFVGPAAAEFFGAVDPMDTLTVAVEPKVAGIEEAAAAGKLKPIP